MADKTEQRRVERILLNHQGALCGWRWRASRKSSLPTPDILVYDRGVEPQNKKWDAVAFQKRFGHPLIMGEIEKFVDRRGRTLDYGCGYGRSIRELNERAFTNLFGVGYSSGMLRRARKETPFAQYVRKSGPEIPFSKGSFDAVLLLAVLTCIPDSGAQAKLFSEIYRVLKEGGILYVRDLLINGDERNKDRYERFERKHDFYGVFEQEEGVTLRHHTREHLERLRLHLKQSACRSSGWRL